MSNDNDPISELMSKEGLSYPQAVERLALKDCEAVRDALKALVNRLDEIAADPDFKSVWTQHHVHGGNYRGPTWVEALASARKALE